MTATFTAEGKLQIDMADVWIWIAEQIKVDLGEGILGLYFSVQNDTLEVMRDGGRPAIEIEAADFWGWIAREHVPLPTGCEILYGVPKFDAGLGRLDMTFAGGDTDPRSWTDQPACLLEWQNDGTGPNPEPEPTLDLSSTEHQVLVTVNGRTIVSNGLEPVTVALISPRIIAVEDNESGVYLSVAFTKEGVISDVHEQGDHTVLATSSLMYDEYVDGMTASEALDAFEAKQSSSVQHRL